MKFVAPKDFSQGLQNPLKISGGAMHVPKGTIFSLGGDTAKEQLTGEDLQTYRTFFGAGCLCPFDSDEGRQIMAEVKRLKEIEEKANKDKFKNNPENRWDKKPFGAVVLTVFGGFILLIIAAILAHYLPKWFHS